MEPPLAETGTIIFETYFIEFSDILAMVFTEVALLIKRFVP